MIASPILLDQPVDQGIDGGPIFRPYVGRVVVQMLEMIVLFEHRCFINVIVSGNPMIVRVLRQLAYIFEVISTDVDIEKDEVSIHVLFAEELFQVFPGWHKRFRETRL